MPEKLASPDDEKRRGQHLKPFCEICRKPISGISGTGSADKPVTFAGRITNWFTARSFCSCGSTGSNSQVVALYEKGLARSEEQVDSASDEEVLPDLPERYEVVEILGHGGMGTVYRVRDRSIDEEFAVKVLRKEMAEDVQASKRFEQEARAQQCLAHPNLIPVFSNGKTSAGAPYMIMGLSSGVSLAELLRLGNKFSEKEVLSMMSQAAEALAHAHSKKIIHRDVKPANLIVEDVPEREDKRLKVVDFGIARLLPMERRGALETAPGLTETGEFVGSPAYMSPEHCLGQDVDERSDVYSLACVMYELLTGEPPFKDDNPVQAVVDHLSTQPPSLSSLNSAVDKQLEKIVLKALSKRPEDRYQSMEEFLDDLKGHQAGRKLRIKLSSKRSSLDLPVYIVLALIVLAAPIFYFVSINSFAGSRVQFSQNRVGAGSKMLEYEDEDQTRGKIYKLRDGWGSVVYEVRAGNQGAAIRKALHEIKVKRLEVKGLALDFPDLHNMDLSGIRLPGARITKARMTNANFSGAFLEGAEFIGCRGPDSHFNKANLKGALFKECRMNRADFKDADLSGTRFEKTELEKSHDD